MISDEFDDQPPLYFRAHRGLKNVTLWRMDQAAVLTKGADQGDFFLFQISNNGIGGRLANSGE